MGILRLTIVGCGRVVSSLYRNKKFATLTRHCKDPKQSNNMSKLFIFICLAAFTTSGFGLKCYQGVGEKAVSKKCDKAIDDWCYKHVTGSTITKSCYLNVPGVTKEGCKEVGKVTTCFCKKDDCNAANLSETSVVATTLAIVLAIFNQ